MNIFRLSDFSGRDFLYFFDPSLAIFFTNQDCLEMVDRVNSKHDGTTMDASSGEKVA